LQSTFYQTRIEHLCGGLEQEANVRQTTHDYAAATKKTLKTRHAKEEEF
jgi:hypothetical protein